MSSAGRVGPARRQRRVGIGPAADAPPWRALDGDLARCTTVTQAYRWLEDAGLIVARPRSGYFAAARPPKLPEPETSLPPPVSQAVDVSQLAEEVIRCANDPDCIAFGAACPSGDLFEPERVRRAITRATRLAWVASSMRAT